MFFLMGEKIVPKVIEERECDCPICQTRETWVEVKEVNYFTVFLIKTFPIDTVSHYLMCTKCENTFSPNNASQPAVIDGVRDVLAYLMQGYGQGSNTKLAQQLHKAATGLPWEDEEFRDTMRRFNHDEQRTQIVQNLKTLAKSIGWPAKYQIVEAAYLITYVCSSLEYEDKVRVNLVGNALGVSLEGVNEIADQLRTEHYKGLQRITLEQ